MKSIARVKFSRYIAYFFIFISVASQTITLPDFLNPINSSAKSNELASSQISPKAKATKKAATNKSNTSKATATANKNGSPTSTVHIDPLRDLGIEKGYVCFRVKAYSKIEVSEFSKAVCAYIKNSIKVKLAWAPTSNAVIGYQVYFGTSAKITDIFITDVM